MRFWLHQYKWVGNPGVACEGLHPHHHFFCDSRLALPGSQPKPRSVEWRLWHTYCLASVASFSLGIGYRPVAWLASELTPTKKAFM
jgi:hypothetical protein